MASSMIDSEIFKNQYGTEEMRHIFSDQAQIQKWLDTWAALAKAEAAQGVIPKAAAKEIAEKATYQNINMSEVREGFKKTAHPLMPQIRSFAKSLSPEAGGYVHWGATTQDITDTGLVLQLKDAQQLIVKQLQELLTSSLKQAKKYRTLIMAGRTHGQQAVPITLGYKIAIWANKFGNHLDRIKDGQKRYLVGELGGAAGTLASLGDKGLAVQKTFCDLLGLETPTITWHVSRDGFAEFASIISMIAGTVARVANEIINLQRTEIGEIEEGFTMGKVGSSTMPQKRNPMKCENIVSLTRIIQANATLGLSSMMQEHERDMTFWQSDWSYLPQICINLSAAMKMLNDVLNQMIVHKDNIKHNLLETKGLIVSERVMLDLGRYLGRQNAHEVIYENAMKAFEEKKPLLDLLLADKRVTADVDEPTLREMLNPEKYSGVSAELVDRVLSKYHAFLK